MNVLCTHQYIKLLTCVCLSVFVGECVHVCGCVCASVVFVQRSEFYILLVFNNNIIRQRLQLIILVLVLITKSQKGY